VSAGALDPSQEQSENSSRIGAKDFQAEHDLAILFPTRGWNAEDWFWAIGPPVYLFAVWMFVLLNDHRNSRRLTGCLAVLILPLILFALHVRSVAGNFRNDEHLKEAT
jgi:hypothetical protein